VRIDAAHRADDGAEGAVDTVEGLPAAEEREDGMGVLYSVDQWFLCRQ
jgi:hypothetical protein